eukprot:m.224946 g.224946  ORF g.224946 m.224946 type:complete len:425 (+) comp13857_c1_seq1:1834-3108(+)
MSEDEDDPTILYEWQRGTTDEIRRAIEKRRSQLLGCDLENNHKAQTEWLALLQERNLLAVQDQQCSKQERKEEIVDELPLCGWLKKRGAKFPYRYIYRWFKYNEHQGHLEYYKSDKSTDRMGHIDLGQVSKIRVDDASGKKFTLVCPTREWHLQAMRAQDMTVWMDEILIRQEKLKMQRSQNVVFQDGDGSDSEDGEDDEEVIDLDAIKAAEEEYSAALTADVIDGLQDDSEAEDNQITGTSSATTTSSTTTRVEYVCDPKILQAMQKLKEKNKKLEEENALLRETARIDAENLYTKERELTLKDQTIQQLQVKLTKEKEALEKQMRDGFTVEELSARLAWSKIDLAHSSSLLDLSNHRLAGAMVMVALYKAMSGGAVFSEEVEDEHWEVMVENLTTSLDNSQVHIESLRQRIEQLEQELSQGQ